MYIRSILTALLALVMIFSCKNNREDTTDSEAETENPFPPTPMEISRKDSLNDRTTTPAGRDDRTSSTTGTTSLQGRYIKTNQESDDECTCYCIEINFETTSELCLVKDEMYIITRLERRNDNSIDVYFEEPSSRNSGDSDMPWQDFDRTTPIARITPQGSNELALDWLGFSINGDLANDYAIYGKDSLEGTYTKE